MDEFKLGTYIKKRREELKMSQEDLCEGLCAVSSLSRIENNQQDPSRNLTKNLLERLGLPREKFTAFWGQKDLTTGSLMREINNDIARLRRASHENYPQIQEQIREKLDELEEITAPDDKPVRQFLLAHKALLGDSNGPYSFEKKLAMQLEAIRLTCPGFDPEDFQRGYYSDSEALLIHQISNTYSADGQKTRAIDMDRQLLWYVEKHFKELAGYASTFCLVAHNFAIRLGALKRYMEALEIAEKGRETCIRYGAYQFLPGFLAVQAECNFFLGREEESKSLYLKAYYIYDAFLDPDNRDTMREEMRERLGIEPKY